MKALAIDSAVSKLTISAKNEDKTCTTIFNIGMKQSETLLPAIEYVLLKVNLTASDLDYMTLTQGPGSFTGLRLAYSALKAIECAYNIPIYGLSSLFIHSYPFLSFNSETYVVSCIDANKDRFYANISTKNNEFLPDGDYSLDELIEKTRTLDNLLICGPDKNKFYEKLILSFPEKKIQLAPFSTVTTDTMFELAEKNIANKNEPLKDFDGPVYLRASEAELVLQQKDNK